MDYREPKLSYCIVLANERKIIARFEHGQDRDYALANLEDRFSDCAFITYDDE